MDISEVLSSLEKEILGVEEVGNFYVVVFTGPDGRQYRKDILNAYDTPLTDQEITIGKLCREVINLRNAVMELTNLDPKPPK